MDKEKARAYYKIYYLAHRQEQIDKATQWTIKHPVRHAIACKKYLMKNKKEVYCKRRVKSLHKILMKELIDRVMYN